MTPRLVSSPLRWRGRCRRRLVHRLPAHQHPGRPPHRPLRRAVRLRAQQPEPDSVIGDRFAVISAEFNRRVEAASVRVWLDGANRTMQSGVSATGFSFKPPAPLDFGSHTVRVAGRASDGATFDRSWSFVVRRPGRRRSLLRFTSHRPTLRSDGPSPSRATRWLTAASALRPALRRALTASSTARPTQGRGATSTSR